MKEHLYVIEESLSENKDFCLQCGNWEDWNWFDFNLRWSRKCDHAGFEINLELFGFYFIFNIYDKRHWNYGEDRWYDEEE